MISNAIKMKRMRISRKIENSDFKCSVCGSKMIPDPEAPHVIMDNYFNYYPGFFRCPCCDSGLFVGIPEYLEDKYAAFNPKHLEDALDKI